MYLKDPTTGLPSVSLTFLVISFVLLVGFSTANVLEYAKDPGPFLELFYACAALYFGRRVSIGNKSFSINNKDTQSNEQINS